MTFDDANTSGHSYRGVGHRMWRSMVERCHSPRNKDYSYYGERGIVVCDRWRASFSDFVDDIVTEIGERPKGCQIDRVDNERGYEPGNVRWVTPKQNSNNRRDNKIITHKGESMTAAQWADRTGIPRQQIANRINRGWDVERALTEPAVKKSNLLTINGQTMTQTEWAKKSGRPRTTIRKRVQAGMSPFEAVFGELKKNPDGICPRCKERPRSEKDHYCKPCRKAYAAERRAAPPDMVQINMMREFRSLVNAVLAEQNPRGPAPEVSLRQDRDLVWTVRIYGTAGLPTPDVEAIRRRVAEAMSIVPSVIYEHGITDIGYRPDKGSIVTKAVAGNVCDEQNGKRKDV